MFEVGGVLLLLLLLLLLRFSISAYLSVSFALFLLFCCSLSLCVGFERKGVEEEKEEEEEEEESEEEESEEEEIRYVCLEDSKQTPIQQ